MPLLQRLAGRPAAPTANSVTEYRAGTEATGTESGGKYVAKRVLLGGIAAAILAADCNAPRQVDRGAYDVIKHYSVLCSGHGGLGEFVIVRSHSPTDLESAFRRWYKTNRHDASRCLYLFLFTSSISMDVFEHETLGHPKRYRAEQRHAAYPIFTYYNDPTTHDERWLSPLTGLHLGGPDGPLAPDRARKP